MRIYEPDGQEPGRFLTQPGLRSAPKFKAPLDGVAPVGSGGALVDESGNVLVDESGNRLIHTD